LFFKRKLIGISIRPPGGTAESQHEDQDAEVEKDFSVAPDRQGGGRDGNIRRCRSGTVDQLS